MIPIPPERVTHLGYPLQQYAICDHERPCQCIIGVGLLYRPKISERPHLKMAHGHVLLLLRERAVLTWTSATARRRRMGFWFCGRRRHVPHVMALDGLLVCARAWPTRPAIAARRFCVQRGLHAAHVEEGLAPIASDGFLSLSGVEQREDGKHRRRGRTGGTNWNTCHNFGVHQSSRARSPSLPPHIHNVR
jgi:hypothetical protein